MIPVLRCKTALLQIMYRDRMTVARQMPVTDDEGADGYKMQDIYSDIPCHLGQYNNRMAGERTDRAYELNTELRVDCDPDYDIWPADVLTVTTEAGDVFILNAARAMKYVTHQEINVRKDGDEA